MTGTLLDWHIAADFESKLRLVQSRQNLADAVRQDEKVDRKIARNQSQFEALDFNAAVADSRMSPASAFVATIRGDT